MSENNMTFGLASPRHAHGSVMIATILSVILAAAAFAAPGDGLEGTTWKFRKAGAIHWLFFWERDYLVFQEGNFIEARLAGRGFSPALYSPTITAHGIDWSCSLENARDEKYEWKGTRVSYWMTGDYIRTKRNGSSKTVRWKAWQIFPKPPKT